MPKNLDDAINDIIEIVRSSTGSQSDPWMEIVKHCESPGMIYGEYCKPIERAIKKYLDEIRDEDKRSIWLDTEIGLMNWDEAEDTDIGSIEMDLEVALFSEVMDQAFFEAKCERNSERG